MPVKNTKTGDLKRSFNRKPHKTFKKSCLLCSKGCFFSNRKRISKRIRNWKRRNNRKWWKNNKPRTGRWNRRKLNI